MTERVRQAVPGYRLRDKTRARPCVHDVLTRIAGLSRHGDGPGWQERLREEWGRAE